MEQIHLYFVSLNLSGISYSVTEIKIKYGGLFRVQQIFIFLILIILQVNCVGVSINFNAPYFIVPIKIIG